MSRVSAVHHPRRDFCIPSDIGKALSQKYLGKNLRRVTSGAPINIVSINICEGPPHLEELSIGPTQKPDIEGGMIGQPHGPYIGKIRDGTLGDKVYMPCRGSSQ